MRDVEIPWVARSTRLQMLRAAQTRIQNMAAERAIVGTERRWLRGWRRFKVQALDACIRMNEPDGDTGPVEVLNDVGVCCKSPHEVEADPGGGVLGFRRLLHQIEVFHMRSRHQPVTLDVAIL